MANEMKTSVYEYLAIQQAAYASLSLKEKALVDAAASNQYGDGKNFENVVRESADYLERREKSGFYLSFPPGSVLSTPFFTTALSQSGLEPTLVSVASSVVTDKKPLKELSLEELFAKIQSIGNEDLKATAPSVRLDNPEDDL